jgi:hypothetical protein
MTQAALHNPERGEVTIMLDGRSWVLRPTWQAIAEIEAATDKPIMVLIREVSVARYRATELAAIVAAGLRGAGEKGVQLDKVGESIVRAGLANPDLIRSVSDFLTNALNGGATPGEGEAADGK